MLWCSSGNDILGVKRDMKGHDMIRLLLTDERIQTIEQVNGGWEEAVALAAQPMVDDGTIDECYIQAMIDAINAHGPYVVLDDYFALPHAKAGAGVNRVGMSLLVTQQPVDLLGKPVCVFLVLAALDHDVHIQALADVFSMWSEPGNAGIIRSGDRQAISRLLDGLE